MQTGALKLVVAKGGKGVVIDGLGLSAARGSGTGHWSRLLPVVFRGLA
jgi:hypothetical protein